MHLNIIGTRGVPAAHGGFETFADYLSRYLVAKGWTVNVYCQDDDGAYEDGEQDMWKGVTRTHFQAKRSGPVGTMEFDLKCIRHVLTQPGIDLVLGYNTAVFCVLERFKGRRILMNMDGIEWKRSKWGFAPKVWFFLNELIGANLAHVAIADHPEIAKHVQARCFKTPVMIPYGSDEITAADPAYLATYGIDSDKYLVSIARIEPENSILELVQGAASLPEGFKAMVLGKFDAENDYHRAVKAAGGDNVIFPGAIYDPVIVQALRFHARAYLHGHQVGGTNPSLVEALGAGNAVLAHDNKFNRWTAGPDQFYFSDGAGAARAMQTICGPKEAVQPARNAALKRHKETFQWHQILGAYENALKEQMVKA
ncbi:DUF1972 domain-containing protein [Pacificibacter marinus]|uniref:DUF1972 domain-containing protein n=1 Tax=Pacificibacter marinus TaxID=658057 RepID=A0A1Y5TW21_9RHOB|nr:DUF1972 domain-containing protein [Pacificibacter marinus]SEL07551.1 Glycosyltransferase involved in cell wall bisynthesis [Pacificibacter marinus]SLN69792.1 hypothetical protein PAM7971_03733 [Pacificibacter marinus]